VKTRWVRLGGLLVAGVILLAACGGGDDEGDGGGEPTGGNGGEPAGATLDVAAAEFTFTPDALTASADTPTTVKVTNTGTIEHDFTIDEASLVIAVNATEEAEDTFTLGAGTYTFYCSVPGHREAGMEGTLTVS
jgi:uncharacterized cupredoxin-like copper-binding protein